MTMAMVMVMVIVMAAVEHARGGGEGLFARVSGKDEFVVIVLCF